MWDQENHFFDTFLCRSVKTCRFCRFGRSERVRVRARALVPPFSQKSGVKIRRGSGEKLMKPGGYL